MRYARFARFLVVGGLAAGVNVLARYLLDPCMSYSAAIVLAYLAGMATAFLLAKWFVFEASGSHALSEFARFGVVNVAAVAQVWVVSVGLAEWFFPWIGLQAHRYDIAHVVGVAVPAVTSYFGHKYYSFARRGQ
jgi:putative flippase GtrA